MKKKMASVIDYCLIILSGSVIILTLPMTAIAQDATPTYVFPPPTYDPVTVAEIDSQLTERELRDLRVDLTCLPVCWLGFSPNQTSTRNAISNLRQISLDIVDPITGKAGNAISTNRGTDALNFIPLINDTAGLYSGAIFSDDTQPETRLRAYSIGLNVTHSMTYALLSPKLIPLLPANILARAGLPRQIGVGFDSFEHDLYSLVFEYDHWLITYRAYVTHNTPNGSAICPTQTIPDFGIWVYSERETDGFSLLHDILHYENIKTIPLPSTMMLMDNYKVANDDTLIQQIVNDLTNTGCIPVNQFAAFPVKATPIPTPTPTSTPTRTPTPPFGGGGDPLCPGGAGGEWMWVDGELIFVCGVTWE
ncbi:MAG: hypothetical protein HS103_06495 [Anaerolineales bacterium]|nr:hypothetical protein [Anaerolineales bacterium]